MEEGKDVVFYIPPSNLNVAMPGWVQHTYSPQHVRDSLQAVINAFCAAGGAGASASGPDAYAWSLYSTLGVPDNVLFDDDSMSRLVQYLTETNPLDLSCVNKKAWHVKTPYIFVSDTRSFTPLRHELHLRNDRTHPPREDLYKLHASVKHQYILYTVLKLSTLYLEGQRPFQLKFQFNSRYSNLTAANTAAFDMKGNGGSVPPIVIYGSTEIASLRTIYQAAHALFPERDQIGLMVQGEPWNIPPLNVRLDTMFAYTLGDRDQKLTRYEQNAEPVCRLPGWLLAKLGQCGANSAAIDSEMRTLFGRTLCDRVDAEGRFQARRADGTVDPICYLSLSAADMGGPEQMQGGKHKRHRKTRRAKRSVKRKGGAVTFRNNTKPPNASNNYSHLRNTYLNELQEHLQSTYYPVAPQHANDAEILGAVQNTYNDPAEMREALRLIYDPQPLTPNEKAVLNMLLTKGIHKGINRVAIAPLSAEMRERILNYLRYVRAVRKIEHTYETEHVTNPKYVHAEWNEKS